MRFHHISFLAILGLICAGSSLAGEPNEAERRFAEQLHQQLEVQLNAMIEQSLAAEVEAIRVPSARPKARPYRSTPVASATSARALPNGELAAAHMACQRAASSSLDCTIARDTMRAGEITALAKKTR